MVQKALLSIFVSCQSKRKSNRLIFVWFLFFIRIGKFLCELLFCCYCLFGWFWVNYLSSSFFKFYFNNLEFNTCREHTWKKYLTHANSSSYGFFSSFVLIVFIWLHFVSKWLKMKSPKYTYNNLKISTLLLFLL